MKFQDIVTFKWLFPTKVPLARKKKSIPIDGKPTEVSPGPSSKRDNRSDTIPFIQKTLKVLQPDYEFGVVPVIRKLAKVNGDMNQALDDFIKLANTGHKIKFDPKVSPEQVSKMRLHINQTAKTWCVGCAGIDGVINKMFRQAMIAGAIATEWVPNMDLTNVEEVRFVYPERIRYVVEKNSRVYQPYQKIENKPVANMTVKDLKKLNPNQFKYYALNGDTDIPYGTPPYIPALQPIVTQKKMTDNIDYVVEAMGLLGYLDALLDKPDQRADESDEAYNSRMTALLNTFKDRVKEGFRDGVNVGFKDDHEFEFQQTVKTAVGVKDLFEQNELLVATGLKYDAAFMGRPGSTETLITILFTKMLAQLANIQNIIKENLEFGYKMTLLLAGFKFESLHVEFRKSTLTDELKYQQGQEIKFRNLDVLYKQGIIGQHQYADESGYEEPDQEEPREDPAIAQQAVIDKENREADKDASDKKVRDKNKPQGTVKKQKQNLNVA